MGQEAIILGIDYSDEYTQISYFDQNMEKPESVSTIQEEQKYLIPSVLCKMKGKAEWSFGDNANHLASTGEGFLVNELLKGVLNKSYVVIDHNEYSYAQLFSLFLQSVNKLVKEPARQEDVTIVFSLESSEKALIEELIEITGDLGYDKNKVKVMNRSESLAYYIFKQPKKLWTHDVVVFDFGPHRFMYYKLTVKRGKSPNVVVVEEEDYSEILSMGMLHTEEGMKLADNKFMELLQIKFNHTIISSVYLLGMGFTKQWFTKSVSLLCSNRKVFQGQNLFSVGACYSGLESIEETKEQENLLVCKGRTMVNIAVLIEHKGKNRQLILSKAGTNWYEAGAKIECILDDIRVLQLILSSPISRINRNISIELEGFPYRPNKTTRIELVIAYSNEKQFDILIKDKGFGELYKASDKVIKQTIHVENYV